MKTIAPIDHKQTPKLEKKSAFLHVAVYGGLFAAWIVMQLHN